jgi:ribosome recycling factor
MTIAEIKANTEQKMVKAMESLAHQLARVRPRHCSSRLLRRHDADKSGC